MYQPTFHNRVHSSKFLAVLFLLSFKLFHFAGQLFMGGKHFPKLYKGANDKDTHLHGAIASEHSGQHGYTMFGKGIRQVVRIPVFLGTGHNL